MNAFLELFSSFYCCKLLILFYYLVTEITYDNFDSTCRTVAQALKPLPLYQLQWYHRQAKLDFKTSWSELNKLANLRWVNGWNFQVIRLLEQSLLWVVM
jgi:hypothetical protein